MQEIAPIRSVGDALRVIVEGAELQELRHWPYSREEGQAHVRYKDSFGIWFRGHSDTKWSLIPSAFPRESLSALYDESAGFYHFMLRTPQDSDARTTFDSLCLMQHYGVPTRLLDWTENLLVALFFAVEGRDQISIPGKLYVLNTRKLNVVTRTIPQGRAAVCVPDSPEVAIRSELSIAISLSDLVDHLSSMPRSFVTEGYLVKKARQQLLEELTLDANERKLLNCLRAPVAVLPARRHARMILQQSVFTLHGGKNHAYVVDKKEMLPSPISLESLNEKLSSEKKFLIEIPVENKSKISRELELMGIHGAALFPELENQAKYIREKWSF